MAPWLSIARSEERISFAWDGASSKAQGDGIINFIVLLSENRYSLAGLAVIGSGYWIAKATIGVGSDTKISFRLELAQTQLVLLSPTLLVARTL